MSYIGGLDFRLRAIGGNIAPAYDGDLVDAHIRFVLAAYLPASFELFKRLPSPIALAEDLRLTLARYIPNTQFQTEGRLVMPEQIEIRVVATWQNQTIEVAQVFG